MVESLSNSLRFSGVDSLIPAGLDEKYIRITEDPFLISLLGKLGTCFASPEEEFMK